jgi:hypothetical protein
VGLVRSLPGKRRNAHHVIPNVIPNLARAMTRQQVSAIRRSAPELRLCVSEGDLNPHPVNPDQALNVARVVVDDRRCPDGLLRSG